MQLLRGFAAAALLASSVLAQPNFVGAGGLIPRAAQGGKDKGGLKVICPAAASSITCDGNHCTACCGKCCECVICKSFFFFSL
jgi:hypothetical protein